MAGATNATGMGVTVASTSSAQLNDEGARHVASLPTICTPSLAAVRAVVRAVSTIDNAVGCLGDVSACVDCGDAVGVVMRSLSAGFWDDMASFA